MAEKKSEKLHEFTGLKYYGDVAAFMKGTSVTISGTCKADSFSSQHTFKVVIDLENVPVEDVLDDFATNVWISKIQKSLRTWGDDMAKFSDSKCHFSEIEDFFENPAAPKGRKTTRETKIADVMRWTDCTREQAEGIVDDPVRYAKIVERTRGTVSIDDI